MKNLILSLSFLALTFAGFSQILLQEKTAEITFETELIDYGTINQYDNGVRTFHFKNTGNTPLIISEARKVCGCTIPSFPKEPILPNESGKIEVKYDTKRLGNFSKSVIIISNASTPELTLKIKGKIVSNNEQLLKVKEVPSQQHQ